MPSWMEPMLPTEGQREIEDAAFDLIARASSLAGQDQSNGYRGRWGARALDELLLLKPH